MIFSFYNEAILMLKFSIILFVEIFMEKSVFNYILQLFCLQHILRTLPLLFQV